jgi:hypothetical protein
MNTTRVPSSVYYILLVLLIAFSFYNFAEINYPLLNSDMAVNVLMAKGVNLPGDLYFWGQDRAGSLIPLLANVFVEAYKFPPILCRICDPLPYSYPWFFRCSQPIPESQPQTYPGPYLVFSFLAFY